MSFKDLICEQYSILNEASKSDFDFMNSEDFDRSKHIWSPMSDVTFNQKPHAVWKKVVKDETGNQVSAIYGIRFDNKFVPFRKGSQHHDVHGTQDLGHTSNDEIARKMLNIHGHVKSRGLDTKDRSHVTRHAGNIKKRLKSIYHQGLEGGDEQSKHDIANLLGNHPHWEVSAPSTKKIGKDEERPGMVMKYKHPELSDWEQKAGDAIGHGVYTGMKKYNPNLIAKSQRPSYQDFYQPEVNWDNRDNRKFLDDIGGFNLRAGSSSEILKKMIQKKNIPSEIEGKTDKMLDAISRLDNAGIVGILPSLYFKNPEVYKKRMLHLISHMVRETGKSVKGREHKNVTNEKEIGAINSIINDLARKVDSGQVTGSDLGKSFYNMSKQFKNPELSNKLEGAFNKNMAKLFVAANKVLNGSFIVIPKGMRAQLGGVVEIFKRDENGTRVSGKPIVDAGAGSSRVTAKREDNIIGSHNSITGILKSLDYKEGVDKNKSIAAVESIKPLLNIGTETDEQGKRIDDQRDQAIIKVMRSPLSSGLKKLLVQGDARLEDIVSRLGSTLKTSDITGEEKAYLVDTVKRNAEKHQNNVKRTILRNAGVHRLSFRDEMKKAARYLSDPQKEEEFINSVTEIKDSETRESLRRVINAITQQASKEPSKESEDKLVNMRPEDVQLLAFLSLVANNEGENITYDHVTQDHDKQEWSHHPNYGLENPEEPYIRKWGGSHILGYLIHHHLKSNKEDPTAYYHTGKLNINASKRQKDSFKGKEFQKSNLKKTPKTSEEPDLNPPENK